MTKYKLPRSRIRPSRLWEEAVTGLMQRPARSLLTSLGTVLAVGSFVAVLGVTSTANGQIQDQFDAKESTQVTVKISADGAWGPEGPQFPDDADTRADAINGVTAAGVSWDVGYIRPVYVSRLPPGIDPSQPPQLSVFAATTGMWKLSDPTMVSGRFFDNSLISQPVAVLGLDAARSLGITPADQNAAIFLNGVKFSVIGIFSRSVGTAAPKTSITIPSKAALRYFGSPGPLASMKVQTRIGASQVVAPQLAVAIDPTHPANYVAAPPPSAGSLRGQVTKSLSDLILMLAALFVLLGVVGIANTSFTATLDRIPEIALKRSLGALPRHIGLQFLVEFTLIGAFGGMLGALLGTATLLIVAAIWGWTPIIVPLYLVVAPFLGAAIGLIASLYSALRATRVEPVEAFRR